MPPNWKTTSSLILPARCCSRWGLHCLICHHISGRLLPCLFTLTINFIIAVIFCCTFLKVALTGRYPASLLYGAQTFLVRSLSALLYATIQLTTFLLYYIFNKISNFFACFINFKNLSIIIIDRFCLGIIHLFHIFHHILFVHQLLLRMLLLLLLLQVMLKLHIVLHILIHYQYI